MKKNDMMRFGSFVWRINPDKLKINSKRNMTTLRQGERFAHFDGGDEPDTVSCSGCFFGKSADSTVSELRQLMAEGKVLPLHGPGLGVIPAKIKSITYEGRAGLREAGYSLEFTDLRGREDYPKAAILSGGYYTAIGGENLWELSGSFGVPAERLVGLNPHIKHINFLREGETVWLR